MTETIISVQEFSRVPVQGESVVYRGHTATVSHVRWEVGDHVIAYAYLSLERWARAWWR
jgi:hypothetical protein